MIWCDGDALRELTAIARGSERVGSGSRKARQQEFPAVVSRSPTAGARASQGYGCQCQRSESSRQVIAWRSVGEKHAAAKGPAIRMKGEVEVKVLCPGFDDGRLGSAG